VALCPCAAVPYPPRPRRDQKHGVLKAPVRWALPRDCGKLHRRSARNGQSLDARHVTSPGTYVRCLQRVSAATAIALKAARRHPHTRPSRHAHEFFSVCLSSGHAYVRDDALPCMHVRTCWSVVTSWTRDTRTCVRACVSHGPCPHLRARACRRTTVHACTYVLVVRHIPAVSPHNRLLSRCLITLSKDPNWITHGWVTYGILMQTLFR
jgi:hypothetical protein